jgi:succinate-semialdehyde dehydrogenase/glutarate-semialdehyde dehydrogenase
MTICDGRREDHDPGAAQATTLDAANGRLPPASRTAYVVFLTSATTGSKAEDQVADYAVVNPATGETIKEYETISDDDLRDAIARASKCHQEWVPTTTVADRAALIRKVAELHTAKRQELAEIIVREMGKPIEQALGEVDFAAAIYEYYADNAEKLLADEPIELMDGEGSALIRRSSYGLLLGIMPWNYPYYQVARFAGPNLVIGNTILLKHAPQCPESAAAMEQIFHEAGFPQDAYINIYATNEQIEWVIADPRVRGVSLTGSERAGAAVAEIAGRNLKKVVLELGGSDPFILLNTDDLDAAVEAAVNGRLENTGQACNAAKRIIVADELYEPFLEKFTSAITAVKPGDPTKEDSTIGPLSSSTATERLASQLKRALDGGAKLVAGGNHEGNYFESTVITDVTPDNEAYYEEFFGPVAQVYRARDEEEAVKLANDTPFGLGSYVYTNDPDQAMRVADKIEAGMVFVNAVGAEGAELPFGGVKRSGFGRELGRYGADEFVNKKLIRIAG